jgi:hypothetical protein
MVEQMFDASGSGAGWIFSLVRDVAAGGATTSGDGSLAASYAHRSQNEIASCSAFKFQDWRLKPRSLQNRLRLNGLESWAGSGEAGKLWPARPLCASERSVSLGLPFNAGRTRISRSWAETCRQFRRFL